MYVFGIDSENQLVSRNDPWILRGRHPSLTWTVGVCVKAIKLL